MSSKFDASGLLIAAGLILAAGFVRADAAQRDVCPLRRGDQVKFIDVFDGKPDEQALLAPDREQAGVDEFIVGDVYKDGRTITIRCKYASGAVADVELKQRVQTCNANRDRSGSVIVSCK